MKKRILFSSTLVLALGVLLFSGCAKEDLTAPVITIAGDASINHILNSTYTDQGATATDDEDGDITSNITVTGTVDEDHTGVYTITYSVTDAAGNTASETRTVTVYNEADEFGGVYANCTDTSTAAGPSAFSSTVTPSPTVNNQLAVSNFGAFGASISVNITISGTNITATTSNQSLGTSATLVQIYTSNTGVVSATPPTRFKIHYQWNDGTNNDVCQSWYNR